MVLRTAMPVGAYRCILVLCAMPFKQQKDGLLDTNGGNNEQQLDEHAPPPPRTTLCL